MFAGSKVGVVGAGAVGASTAYALLIQRVAGEVVLYDIDEAKATAEVLDLAHGSQFTAPARIYGGADIAALAGCDVIVITAGAKQKVGQTRLELAKTNAEILRGLMPRLVREAPDAIYVIVSNPCDVLAYAAVQYSGLPASRVFSSGTVLDSSRLRWMLAERLNVSTDSVHALIIGEHGDSEFALWSGARIGTTPLTQWRLPDGSRLGETELDSIAEAVKIAAYKVIQGKGATNYAIGLSAARIVQAVLRDERVIMPVSTVLSGYHGISGVALSVPTILGIEGATEPLELELTAKEQEQLLASARAIRAAIDTLGLE